MESIEKIAQKAGGLRRQSRRLLILALITAGMSNTLAYGQTFSEWFRQKSTQKKYLLQQISALMMYRQYAQHGYEIAKGGLAKVSGHLLNEFELHGSYYDRLKKVNSIVKDEPQVAEIIRWQRDILSLAKEADRYSVLSPDERNYIRSVRTAVLNNCDGELHDLETILNDGKLEMGDEQRLRQIGRIHRNMKSNFLFTTKFANELKLYVLLKANEKMDVHQIKYHYGITK